jgi:hypothetical protein
VALNVAVTQHRSKPVSKVTCSRKPKTEDKRLAPTTKSLATSDLKDLLERGGIAPEFAVTPQTSPNRLPYTPRFVFKRIPVRLAGRKRRRWKIGKLTRRS